MILQPFAAVFHMDMHLKAYSMDRKAFVVLELQVGQVLNRYQRIDSLVAAFTKFALAVVGP